MKEKFQDEKKKKKKKATTIRKKKKPQKIYRMTELSNSIFKQKY